jgi:flagellar hook-associated protein 1 FlgK
MAALRNAPILEGNSQTVSDYYQSIIVRVGINSKANQDNLSLQQSFVDDFSSRRQEVSGVSTDEEVTSLMQFQRAYEASARVITVADRMLETLVNLVG